MTWPTDRLSRLADVWPSNVDKHSIEGQQSIRLCNYTDVYKNPSIDGSMAFMPATATPAQIERFRLAVGDILITKDSETADDIGIPAFVEYEAPDLICGYHLAIVRPDLSVAEPRFVYWALTSEFVLRQWSVLASGVTRVALRSADLLRVQVPHPPLKLQRSIADYLDRETAQIDTLIAKQEQLIATLRERKVSMVSHTVTRGLHADVASCETDVPWLGRIPRHWRLQPLWSLFDRIKDVNHPEEQMLSVFREYGVVVKDDHANINQTAENRNIYQLVHPGWLVANRMKAWQGSVGISRHRGIVSGVDFCAQRRRSVIARCRLPAVDELCIIAACGVARREGVRRRR